MTNLLVKTFVKDYKNTSSPAVRTTYGKLCGWVGIFCNVFLFIIKFIVGNITKSMSITADAINNLSDAGSSIVNLIGFKLAGKPADKEHPYGHGRYEYIAALSVSVIIMIIGAELLKTGILKVISPSQVSITLPSVIILLISVIIKLWMTFFNRKIGKTIDSQALIAASEDSRNDCFSTGAVLISLIITVFFKINIDGFICIGVSLFILYSGFGLIKETLDTLLGKAPDEDFVNNIEEKIMSYPKVLGTHDLIVHDYGPGRRFASVHVEVAAEDPVLESHDAVDNIEKDFLEKYNINLIVHMDPIVTADSAVSDIRHHLSKYIKNIDKRLSIHDLRIVPGNTHTNVIFDCVVPPDTLFSQNEIRAKIEEYFNKTYENYYAVITFDSSYAPIQKQK